MFERARARAAAKLAPQGSQQPVVEGTRAAPEAVAVRDISEHSSSHITARSGLGTIADIIAVVSALASTWALVRGGPLPQSILACLLGLLALSFMALSFQLQRNQARQAQAERRRARHAQSLEHLADAVASLREAAAKLGFGEHPSAFALPAHQSVDALAAAMSTATGQKCRVVVKTIYAPGGREDVAVKTFATSGGASTSKHDEEGGEQDRDWVKENTDFDEIFYQDRDFFLSNDLSRERGYKNSHFTPASLRDGYPYLSTIVWPIYGPSAGEGGGSDILGFLCTDTREAGSFDKDLDVVVGQTLAPVWYMALQRLDEATELLEL